MTNYFWTVHKRQLDEILKRLAAQSEKLEQLDAEDKQYVIKKYQQIEKFTEMLLGTKKKKEVKDTA